MKIYGNFGSRVPQRAHQASWLRGKRRGQLSGSRGDRPQVTVDLEYPGAVVGLGCRVRDQSDSGDPRSRMGADP